MVLESYQKKKSQFSKTVFSLKAIRQFDFSGCHLQNRCIYVVWMEEQSHCEYGCSGIFHSSALC